MDNRKREHHIQVSNPHVHRLKPGTHGGQVSHLDELLARIGITPRGGQVVVREIIVSDLLGEPARVTQLEQLGQRQAGQRLGGRVDGPDADVVPLSDDPSVADDEQALTLPQALDVIPGIDKMVCIEAGSVQHRGFLIRRWNGILRDERPPSPFRLRRRIVCSRTCSRRQEDARSQQGSRDDPPCRGGRPQSRWGLTSCHAVAVR